ncbi:hypothetical protein D3C78_1682750 [compost metagenome]
MHVLDQDIGRGDGLEARGEGGDRRVVSDADPAFGHGDVGKCFGDEGDRPILAKLCKRGVHG